MVFHQFQTYGHNEFIFNLIFYSNISIEELGNERIKIETTLNILILQPKQDENIEIPIIKVVLIL
jgi:small-conductance mechanosensitive channel